MLKGSSKIIPRKPIIDDIFAENDLGLHLFNIIETFTVYFNVNRFITPEYKVRIAQSELSGHLKEFFVRQNVGQTLVDARISARPVIEHGFTSEPVIACLN